MPDREGCAVLVCVTVANSRWILFQNGVPLLALVKIKIVVSLKVNIFGSRFRTSLYGRHWSGLSTVLWLMVIPSMHAVSLVDRSPFIRPDFEADAALVETPHESSNAADYEFHGVYELGNSTHVLLKTKSDGTYTWHTVGRGEEGIVPKFYDADNDELVIVMKNSEIRLTLMEMGEFKPMPVASGPSSAQTNIRSPLSASSQRPSFAGDSGNRSGVSSIVRRLPRSPIGSMTSGSNRSRPTLEQMQPIINSAARTVPQSAPDASDSPESKPPRGAPNLPIDFPSPPKGPGG